MSVKINKKPLKIVKTDEKEDDKRKVEIGVSSHNFPSAEEMQKGIQDIEDLIEQTNKAQEQNNVTVDNYTLKFGKWKGLLAKS